MTVRPVTPPPPISIAKIPHHIQAGWVTPASPTRPGPPVLAPPIDGSPAHRASPRELFPQNGDSQIHSSSSPVAASPGPPVKPVPVTAPVPVDYASRNGSTEHGISLDSTIQQTAGTPINGSHSREPITSQPPINSAQPTSHTHVNGSSHSPTIQSISAPIAVEPIIPRQYDANIEHPIVIDPAHVDPVVIENPEVIRSRKEAEEKEAREIIRAVRKVKRIERRRYQGIDNDDLNALIRSADKLVHHVQIAPPAYGAHPEDALDLNPAEREDVTLEKLRSHLERFYSSIVCSGLRVVKEVNRIRRWDDGGIRTRNAMIVYIIAWYFGLIIASLLVFLAVLILYPPSRNFCFGPKSHSVDISANPDIPTNTLVVLEEPEYPWGPSASEQQASVWAANIESTLMAAIIPGKGTQTKGKEMVKKVDQHLERNAEDEVDTEEMGTRQMGIEVYGRPGLKVFGGIVDKWERIANAINPVPPFVTPSRDRVIYMLLLPALAGSLFVTPKMVSMGIGAGVGFATFGKPVIDWTLEELNRRFPGWPAKLIIKLNILADVPTNPQLVIRLMRDAEHQRRPIPHPTPEKEVEDDMMLGNGTDAETDSDLDSSSDSSSSDDEGDNNEDGPVDKMMALKEKWSKGKRARIRKRWDKLGEKKEETFALVTGKKKFNYEEKAKRAMAKLHIKQEGKLASKVLDKLPAVDEDDRLSNETPSRFFINHSGHGPGHLIIYPPVTTTTIPITFTPARIALTTISKAPTALNATLAEAQLDPISDHLNPSTKGKDGEKGDLVIDINDIIGMKKTGVGKIKKIALEWALDVEGAGGTGLELTIKRRTEDGAGGAVGWQSEKTKEEVIELKGIVRRDELFDRLLTLGEQRWELW